MDALLLVFEVVELVDVELEELELDVGSEEDVVPVIVGSFMIESGLYI